MTPVSFGVQFTNGLGATITKLDISNFGELWRIGTPGITNTLRFSYSLNATALGNGTFTNFAPLDYAVTPVGVNGAFDGNANRTFITAALTNLNLQPGSSIFLRWTGVDSTNLDHGMAIDDFSLSATTAVPEPASWTMLIAGFGLVGALLRKRRASFTSLA